MNRRQVIGVLGVATAAGVRAEPSDRERIVGVWKLISFERKASEGGDIVQAYGPNPLGRIVYDKAGRISAILMRPDRKPVRSIQEASLEDLRQMQTGFVAYFGTYTVDEAAKTVYHHVKAAFNPAWPGTDLKRRYEISGNRLTLLTTGGNGDGTLIWDRETD
jgi:hypothetical protein